MSVGKRHLYVNGPMVTKVWSSGTRRAKLTRLDRWEGKRKGVCQTERNGRAPRRKKKRRIVVSFRFGLSSVVNISPPPSERRPPLPACFFSLVLSRATISVSYLASTDTRRCDTEINRTFCRRSLSSLKNIAVDFLIARSN